MQVTVIQAQEDYQKPLNDRYPNMTITDTIQEDTVLLSQFNKMKSNEIINYLEKNDRKCFLRYYTGRSVSRTGMIAIIPAMVTTGIGSVIIAYTDHYRMRDFGILGYGKVITWEYLCGLFVTIVGSVATVISTTLIIIGSNLKQQAKEEYINKYFSTKNSAPSTLQIGYTGNGIALSIHF